MDGKRDTASLCTSVFREAPPEGTAAAFTQRWVELIDRLEREKEQLLSLSQEAQKR